MKRKSQIIAILLLSLGICLLSGCEDKETQKEVGRLVDVLETHDAAKVLAASDQQTQENYTVETIQARFSSFYDALAVEKVDYKNIKRSRKDDKDGTMAYKAKVVLSLAEGDIEKETLLRFSKKDDKLLLHWEPSAIFNGVTMENTLDIKVTPGKRGTIFARDGEVLAKDGKDGIREYPYGPTAGAVVGYVRGATADEIKNGIVDKHESLGTQVGRAGLEKAYNDILEGKSGLKVTLSDQPNDPIYEVAASDGKDIKTTLDMKLQQSAYNVVNGEFSAVSAVEPKTGQVLALVDGVSYDPNNWVDSAMDADNYAHMLSANMAPDNGLFADRFTPGSTQKLLTTMIAFKAGTLTQHGSYEIYGEDWAPPGGWGSYKVHRVVPINGVMTLRNALVYSDNIFFARVGLDMGYDNFNNGMKALGIGEKVPGAYDVQVSQINNIGGIKEGHETGLADSSYGQYQVQVSPLQQTLIYAALQNGGKIMKPRYLLEEKPEVWIDDVISSENISFINEALRAAVTVSHPIGDRSYAAFSGKTGTAEVGPDGSINLGWFVGSDLNNPTCTMCVMVNHVENRGGSDVNAAYFGRIMDGVYAEGSYKPSGLQDNNKE